MAQSVGFGACCCNTCALSWADAPDVVYCTLHNNFNDAPHPTLATFTMPKAAEDPPGIAPYYSLVGAPPSGVLLQRIRALICSHAFDLTFVGPGDITFYPCYQPTVNSAFRPALIVQAVLGFGGPPSSLVNEYRTEAGAHVSYTTWQGYHAGIVTEYDPTTLTPINFHWHTAMKRRDIAGGEWVQCLLGFEYHLHITETPP